jgi:2-iminobutanoate/2-iminopropanoate deaminase
MSFPNLSPRSRCVKESIAQASRSMLLPAAGLLLLSLPDSARSSEPAVPFGDAPPAAATRSPAATIKRSTPDVGYIDPAMYKSINVSQTVRVNDTVYLSGIVAATGQGEVVAKGDAAGQVRAVLRTLERLLAEEGMSLANLVSTTVYASDVDAIAAQLPLFAQAFEGHPPTMTMIEVKRLASPDYMLELVAIAAR